MIFSLNLKADVSVIEVAFNDPVTDVEPLTFIDPVTDNVPEIGADPVTGNPFPEPPLLLSAWEAVIANELVTTPTKPAPLPVNEPVEEPVNDPDSIEYLLLENEPVNGPSPLAANEPDVILFIDWLKTCEAVTAKEAEVIEPNTIEAVSAEVAFPSNWPINLVAVKVFVEGV